MQPISGRYECLTLPDRNLPPSSAKTHLRAPFLMHWILVMGAGENAGILEAGDPHKVWLGPLNLEPVKWRHALSDSWEVRLHFLGEAGFSGKKDPRSCWTAARKHPVALPCCKLLPGSYCCCGPGCLLCMSLFQAAAPCPCAGWLEPAPVAPAAPMRAFSTWVSPQSALLVLPDGRNSWSSQYSYRWIHFV